MSAVWLTVGLLALATAAIRASGPVLLGGRSLGERTSGLIVLLAPALLAALIVVETVGGSDGSSIELDERLAGVGAAGAVLAWRRTALLGAVATAAVVTALARAAG